MLIINLDATIFYEVASWGVASSSLAATDATHSERR